MVSYKVFWNNRRECNVCYERLDKDQMETKKLIATRLCKQSTNKSEKKNKFNINNL